MPRVVHFELPADEPDRAAAFYKSIFGWSFDKWGAEEYWLITTGEKGQPGIDGGMGRRSPHNQAVVNTVDVPSVDDYSAKVLAAGGKILMPKVAIPTVGWLAYCQDTEGNAFGIMEEDSAAT
jgi:predicted enzyme related to lactoylglutathione lyase